MPEQREADRKRSQERAEGGKCHADFRGFVLSDQVRGKTLEDILQLVRTHGRVIFAAGHIGNFLERRLINARSESSTAKPLTTASLTAKPLAAP